MTITCALPLFVCLITATACGGSRTNAVAPSSPADRPDMDTDGTAAPDMGPANNQATGGGPGGGPIPEPTTIILVGSGLMLLARYRRRRPQTA